MSKRRQQARWTATAVGFIATLLVITIYSTGSLDWLEHKTLDLRFRYLNSIPESDRLVCIDIDDEALEIVGRWPWPRDIQAALISILHEAGLAALLYDIELTDPEPVRSVVPRNADLELDPVNLTAATDELSLAFPDHELRLAIAAANPVYLAFHYQSTPVVEPSSAALVADLRAWLDQQDDPGSQTSQSWTAAALGAFGAAGHGRSEIVAALRRALSERATLAAAELPRPFLHDYFPAAHVIVPVYFPHAHAAQGCGFVVFEPDADGVMRRVPLLAFHESTCIPQLAFRVALAALGVDPAEIDFTHDRLTLRVPQRARPIVIQLDERGRAIVPWVPRQNWAAQFGPHVPIATAWQVFDRRLSIEQNRRLVLETLGQLRAAGRLAEWQTFHEDLRRRLELDGELRQARYQGDAQHAAQIEDWILQYEAALAADQAALRQQLATSRPASDPEKAEPKKLQLLARAFDQNDAYRAEIDQTLDWLRARVAGKIGLLGYTATALADMTPIPTHPRAPGVIAHANLLSGLLTGRTVSWAPVWLISGLTLLVGGLTTLVAARGQLRPAGVLAAALAVVHVTICAAVFYRQTVWLAVTPVVAAISASYAAVFAYRYMFLERESRQIATALSQYTSAALARQMAEDAELCKRAETREVTAVFTDLASFTTISERIGAERTQRVLNVTLDRFSDAILRHEGMINKFIGDGIFAFWNPVIYPQPDHALRACETAVDLHAALRALIDQQRRAGGDDAFAQLVLRIGIATGPAVVGPCGSEKKYDYTCIGDSVNVAARLESANKFYGTRILVSGPTRDVVGERFAFRPLGGVQVKGKTQAVPIFELLGRTGEVPDTLQIYAEFFAEAITTFQAREWTLARERFQACLESRPDDSAASAYLAAAERCATEPPPADWNGALELLEK